MNTKIFGIFVFLLIIIVTLEKVEILHTVDLETGKQRYARSIFNIVVSSWSEDSYKECTNWKNPYLGVSGKVILSECSLLLGCKKQNYEIISEGCNT